MTTAEQDLATITALADERDWRYFEFYAEVVQTLGNTSAGERIRRFAAAAAVAEECGQEHADRIRETYMNLIVPNFAGRTDDLDVRRAITQIVQTLQRCPRVAA